MLDQETKKRIDNACNILVGKVPTPLAQVEQITLALIYKFMNDMDRRALVMGGKASYFVGEQEKYSWDNLMDTRLGARERADLYEEGLARLSLNASLPDLFRGIFKDASVPYKDPRTLNLFLQEINGFSYEDSENLGDAYEYLLGKTGSQGEAGQFRTPRHIIDFIVQVVDPGKHDTILDPACGTAGFLISAIKHIYRTNTKDIEGDLLTTKEIMGLSNNVFGYDITPDMVRISRVNMFLHNINQPHIYEYDTLSSLDKWDDNFSCILANPPFMTPKGGVVPHNRFSIKSSRSEVLFVDYMLEHLTVDGKAGIIVPEGIIFKSDKACKMLRKKLVEENYLAGVISLPGGVFNPYAGVKTSILWIDRALAKKTNQVIFLKVNADGYDLGANRRPIEANDLPAAIANAMAFKQAVFSGNEYQAPDKGVILVEKTTLVESGNFNLSGDRYNNQVLLLSHYELVKLYKIADFINGYPFKRTDWETKGYKIVRIQNLTGSNSVYNYTTRKDIPARYVVRKNDLLISWSATIGFYIWKDEDAYLNQHIFKVVPKENINLKYLYYLGLKITEIIMTKVHGNTMQHITKDLFDSIEIPLPPLSVQEEIVAELDSYQKIIDGSRQVADNYKPHIDIDPEWKEVTLSDISVLITKGTTPTTVGYRFIDSGIKFIKIETISERGVIDCNQMSFISDTCQNALFRSQLKENDILFSIAGYIGISAIVGRKDIPANTNQALAIIRLKDDVNPRYVLYYLRSPSVLDYVKSMKAGVAQSNLSLKQVSNIPMRLPGIIEQQSIVERIENEQKLVEANRELIDIYEQKIKNRIEKLWKS